MRIVLSEPLALLAACLLGAGSVVLAPTSERLGGESRLGTPTPPLLARAASLGRHAAASDLLWLRAVQFIGTPGSEQSGYPGLGAYLHRVVDLDPAFSAPYFTGGILLSTLPDQVDAAAQLLERGERHLVPPRCLAPPTCPPPPQDIDPDRVDADCAPCAELEGCNWELPLWRGFVSYFGQLDSAAAAQHYCEASRRGGPPYVQRFTERIARQTDSCRALREGLMEVLAGDRGSNNTALLTESGQLRIVVNCERNALRQAAGSYRLRFGKNPTGVEDLVREGLVERPFAPPGLCWSSGAEGFALEPCSKELP